MAVYKNASDNANFNEYSSVEAPSGMWLIVR